MKSKEKGKHANYKKEGKIKKKGRQDGARLPLFLSQLLLSLFLSSFSPSLSLFFIIFVSLIGDFRCSLALSLKKREASHRRKTLSLFSSSLSLVPGFLVPFALLAHFFFSRNFLEKKMGRSSLRMREKKQNDLAELGEDEVGGVGDRGDALSALLVEGDLELLLWTEFFFFFSKERREKEVSFFFSSLFFHRRQNKKKGFKKTISLSLPRGPS